MSAQHIDIVAQFSPAEAAHALRDIAERLMLDMAEILTTDAPQGCDALNAAANCATDLSMALNCLRSVRDGADARRELREVSDFIGQNTSIAA